MLSSLTAAVHFISNRKKSESNFSIRLSWSHRAQISSSNRIINVLMNEPSNPSASGALDPLTQIGRRKSLAIQLSRINFSGSKSTSFEILAAERKNDGCVIHGVMQFDADSESAAGSFANFMEKREQILEAVIKAFHYRPDFENEYIFRIEISQSATGDRADKVKLAEELLIELGAKDIITRFRTMSNVSVNERKSVRDAVFYIDQLQSLDFSPSLIFALRNEMNLKLEEEKQQSTLSGDMGTDCKDPDEIELQGISVDAMNAGKSSFPLAGDDGTAADSSESAVVLRAAQSSTTGHIAAASNSLTA